DRLHRLRGGLAVPQFHRDDDRVGAAGFGGMLHHSRGFDLRVAQLALHAQPIAPDGVGMRAARDENDFLSGLRQARAVVSAHAAAAHHEKFHRPSMYVCSCSMRNCLSSSISWMTSRIEMMPTTWPFSSTRRCRVYCVRMVS